MGPRPKTSGQRADDELKAKARAQLANCTDPIEKLRLLALCRGSSGIMGLGK